MSSTRRRRHVSRSQTRKLKSRSPLRAAYGEVILKKGTVLYRTSYEPFTPNQDKPMLFMLFHPSEWGANINTYVTRIMIKRDISLLFMVNSIYRMRVFPLLNTLIGRPRNNLAKCLDTNLKCYVEHLKRERFQGWFSSIEGRSTIEVAILNDPTLFEVVSSEPLIRDWNIEYMDPTSDTNYMPKTWGSHYPVTGQSVEFYIHRRYKQMVDAYMREGGAGEELYALQILLKRGHIHYHDGPAPSADTVAWVCPPN